MSAKLSGPRTHGGARNGAGRHALPPEQRAISVSMRVRPAVAACFSAWCRAACISQARAFAAWVATLK